MQMICVMMGLIFFLSGDSWALSESSQDKQSLPKKRVSEKSSTTIQKPQLSKKPSVSADTVKKLPKKKTSKIPSNKTPPPPVEETEVFTPPPASEDVAEILYPDEIGEKVSHMVVGLANRLDSFFGDKRSDDERNGSTLRIIPSYTFFDKRKGVAEFGVNLNLKLINLETKARNLEKKIREGLLDSTRGLIEEDPASSSNPKKSSLKKKEEIWHYNFESMLASRPAIYYSGKLRARRNFEGEVFLHHFYLSGGWDTDDYWSQKTSFYSDNALTDSLLFRFVNEADWYITKKLFQTTHGPSLIQTINQYNSVSYNFRIVFAEEEREFHHINSVYSLNYRHGTPSKRIFIDLIPSYAYPRGESYDEIRSFEIRLEYFFGDINY